MNLIGPGLSGSWAQCAQKVRGSLIMTRSAAYSTPRVIHRRKESPQELLPAASVNNSAAQKRILGRNVRKLFPQPGKHASPGYEFRGLALDALTHSFEPGDVLVLNEYSVADRLLNRSHYKPFARISQRVFAKPVNAVNAKRTP